MCWDNFFGTSHMMGFGMGILGWVWMIVLAALVAVIVGALIRYISRASRPGKTPLDILKERYARGEITAEEFERMKRDIGA